MKAADRARLERSDVRKRLAAGTRRGRERRPNAADTAAPPATQAASTRARRALPAAYERSVMMRGMADAAHWAPRIITGASKRGEPLREGRLWRSRRKAGRATRKSLGRRR